MEEKQTIMALGAGATTKFVLQPKQEERAIAACNGGTCSRQLDMHIERVENVKDVGNYLERVEEMIKKKMKKMREISFG